MVVAEYRVATNALPEEESSRAAAAVIRDTAVDHTDIRLVVNDTNAAAAEDSSLLDKEEEEEAAHRLRVEALQLEEADLRLQ